MVQSIEIITIGSVLGLTAGISPGPIFTLVLTQTLKHNKKEGIKIALSPLITDLPIVLISVLIFSKLNEFDSILAVISFVGAAFVAYLGYDSFKTEGMIVAEDEELKAGSLKKGIVANFLSPHPYLFWATIGTPYIFKALGINVLTAALFILSFYLFLTGSKVLIAIMVARSKKFIGDKTYIVVMKVLGIVLFGFSVLFFYDGVKYLGL